MSTSENTICLALETAVGSGSVAVLLGGIAIAESDPTDMRPARAEGLLAVIREVMEVAGVGLNDIGLVAGSTGPGSYSGIRIGLSTAVGLKNALGVECRGVSLLKAIAAGRALDDGIREIVAAVPVGRNDIAWQRLDNSGGALHEISKPALVSITDFKTAIENIPQPPIQAPRALLQRLGYEDRDGAKAADDGVTLAALVGKLAVDCPDVTDLRPIYLRSGTGF